MATTVQDVLSISTVFAGLQLLRNDDEIAAFGANIGSEIITEIALVLDPTQSTPSQGRRLQVPRDRMFVETAKHSTRVVREYPAGVNDVGSVVRLAGLAATHTDRQKESPAAFGFNIDMVYDQDSGEPARTYLGRRLFARANELNERWTHVGGAGKLFAHEEDCQWAISLEPRMHSADTARVFLSANLHVPEARMPSDNEMDRMLRRLWDGAHDLIENLDRRDHG